VLHVFSRAELEGTITRLVLDGYLVANRTSRAATMVRRKRLDPAWVILGVLTLTVGLWIYLVVHLCRRDRLVHVVLEAPVVVPEAADRPARTGRALGWPVAAIEGDMRPDRPAWQ
jgi:hypothetical protein